MLGKNIINSYIGSFSIIEKQNLFKITFFNVIFLCSMFLSSNLFILFLKDNNLNPLIGVYYSLMSILGIGAIFYSKIFNYFDNHKVMIIGVVFYAIGLYFRAYPEYKILLYISAVIAALGANLIIIGSRFWILYFNDINNQAKASSIINFFPNILKNILLFTASFLIFLKYEVLLILIALFSLLSVFFIPKISFLKKDKSMPKIKTPFKVLTIFIINNFFSGFVGFINTTLLIALLNNKNISSSSSITIISILGLISIISNLTFSKYINTKNLYINYIIWSLLTSTTLFIILNNSLQGFYAVALFFGLHIFKVSLSTTLDLIDNLIAKNYNTFLLLSLVQTTGLLGATISGFLSDYFINKISILALIILCLLYFISNVSMVFIAKNKY